MKNEGTVRLCPVQIDRDGGDGDMLQRERDDDWAPPGQVENAGKEQVVYSDLRVHCQKEFRICRAAVKAYFEP